MGDVDDYDPHLHRADMLKHSITDMEALFHIFKGCLGTGVLAMPEAFKLVGMVHGTVLTCIIGVFCTYCLHVLVKGQYVLCKKRKVGLLRYGESMRIACEVGPEVFRPLGDFAALMTDSFLILYQVGTCCVYVVYVGTSIKQITEVYIEKKMPLFVYMLVIFAPFLLILFVKNLKYLAPFSLLADLFSVATFMVVFYYIFQDLEVEFTERTQFGSVWNFPLLFGTVLFSLQSVPIVTSVENQMATPKSFRKLCGPLNLAFFVLTVIYTVVAIMGFWRYGDDVDSPITRNFPISNMFVQAIVGSYCLALYVSYALNGYVPMMIIWDLHLVEKLEREEASNTKKFLIETSMRIFYAILTFFLATTIPLLGLFISLTGSLFLSALGIIFPAFIEMSANWEEELSRPGTAMFWKDVVLVIMGIFGLFCGSYSAIRGIVDTLMSGDY